MTEILLGVDYGDTRTGLAVSAGKMAFGAGCVVSKSMRKTVEGVAQAAQRREAVGIVIGKVVDKSKAENMSGNGDGITFASAQAKGFQQNADCDPDSPAI